LTGENKGTTRKNLPPVPCGYRKYYINRNMIEPRVLLGEACLRYDALSVRPNALNGVTS
jgi:hypothetical protein